MKAFGVLSTTLLLLLLGSGVSVCAQQDQHEDVKPQTQEEEKPPKQDEAKPAKPQEDKSATQENENKEEKKQEGKETKEDKASRQDEGTHQPAQNDHPMQPAQGRAGQAGHIPDDQLRAHFGRDHRFRIGHPTVVEGQPRFQYGGYWFVMTDPWPAGWDYNDEVYVDYIDGVYYLIDPLHPGVQIVVNVIL
jgi:hypothetical protein